METLFGISWKSAKMFMGGSFVVGLVGLGRHNSTTKTLSIQPIFWLRYCIIKCILIITVHLLLSIPVNENPSGVKILAKFILRGISV